MNKKLRFGILSTAKIAREHVIPAIQQSRYAEVTAIASRNIDQARAVAKEAGIPAWYGSYEALLGSPEIDAIYNPLPNHLHVPWSLRAMEKGKHILCEKPIGTDSRDACSLLEASRAYPDVYIMEAFMYRFHPRWIDVRKCIEDGHIGQPIMLHAFFSFFNDDPKDIRNKYASQGGGGLLDIGCYCVSCARMVFGEEPKSVSGSLFNDPSSGVDYIASGVLTFSKGTSVFSCSMRSPFHQYVKIFGTKGHIYLDHPFNPPADQSVHMELYDGEQTVRRSYAPCNQFTLQADGFAEAVLNKQPVPFPLEDAVSNMDVLSKLA
ncbi:Gfo/Idh/MocA family oxidoreductase, partial [Balneolaceae bacterium ANBcel3]|nr:Gfo/Idh/MocA family oxidoreductase [Balneolaceae bacterium ANBcel3]